MVMIFVVLEINFVSIFNRYNLIVTNVVEELVQQKKSGRWPKLNVSGPRFIVAVRKT